MDDYQQLLRFFSAKVREWYYVNLPDYSSDNFIKFVLNGFRTIVRGFDKKNKYDVKPDTKAQKVYVKNNVIYIPTKLFNPETYVLQYFAHPDDGNTLSAVILGNIVKQVVDAVHEYKLQVTPPNVESLKEEKQKRVTENHLSTIKEIVKEMRVHQQTQKYTRHLNTFHLNNQVKYDLPYFYAGNIEPKTVSEFIYWLGALRRFENTENEAIQSFFGEEFVREFVNNAVDFDKEIGDVVLNAISHILDIAEDDETNNISSDDNNDDEEKGENSDNSQNESDEQEQQQEQEKQQQQGQEQQQQQLEQQIQEAIENLPEFSDEEVAQEIEQAQQEINQEEQEKEMKEKVFVAASESNLEINVYDVKDVVKKQKELVSDKRFEQLANYLKRLTHEVSFLGSPKDEGKIDPRLYSNYGVDNKLFRKKTSRKTKPKKPNVILLFDESGSTQSYITFNGKGYMLNEIIHGAGFNAFVSLYSNRINCSAWGHTTKHGSLALYGIASYNMPFTKGLTPVTTPDFFNRFKLAGNIHGGTNGDGDVMNFLSNKFPKNGGRNIMIVLSDGMPSTVPPIPSGINAVNWRVKYTKTCVELVSEKGVDVISLSLTKDVMNTNDAIYGERNYDASENVHNVLSNLVREIAK